MRTREFTDLGALALHLATLGVAMAAAQTRGLERVARRIEGDAKAQIGHYQGPAGPFPAWAPLAESTEAEKARLGYRQDAPLLREGDLRDSITHEVRGNEAVVGSKSPIAAYQEFGTDKIPPRPFIGPAAVMNEHFIQQELGRATVEGLTGGQAIAGGAYDFTTR